MRRGRLRRARGRRSRRGERLLRCEGRRWRVSGFASRTVAGDRREQSGVHVLPGHGTTRGARAQADCSCTLRRCRPAGRYRLDCDRSATAPASLRSSNRRNSSRSAAVSGSWSVGIGLAPPLLHVAQALRRASAAWHLRPQIQTFSACGLSGPTRAPHRSDDRERTSACRDSRTPLGRRGFARHRAPTRGSRLPFPDNNSPAR